MFLGFVLFADITGERMKTQRSRFNTRKKTVEYRNAQFKKLTAGFMEYPQAATDRSKQHKSASFKQRRSTKKK